MLYLSAIYLLIVHFARQKINPKSLKFPTTNTNNDNVQYSYKFIGDGYDHRYPKNDTDPIDIHTIIHYFKMKITLDCLEDNAITIPEKLEIIYSSPFIKKNIIGDINPPNMFKDLEDVFVIPDS
jgi:hypothetical protein